MKILICGTGPIGSWLALKFEKAGRDVSLLSQGKTHLAHKKDGVRSADASWEKRLRTRAKIIEEIEDQDHYDLLVVPMEASIRPTHCPIFEKYDQLDMVLFLGNEVPEQVEHLDHLPTEQLLLGFPSIGGDLVLSDRDKPDERDKICITEFDGRTRKQTEKIRRLFAQSGIAISADTNMHGWFAYHMACRLPPLFFLGS
jgi:ketopantoate reductase